MTPKTPAPEDVLQLTHAYLQKLSDEELQEHFIQLSNQFASRLNHCKGIDELKELQGYLRMIGAEMSQRLKS